MKGAERALPAWESRGDQGDPVPRRALGPPEVAPCPWGAGGVVISSAGETQPRYAIGETMPKLKLMAIRDGRGTSEQRIGRRTPLSGGSMDPW